MLFPGKKYHNRGHQPVVLGILASFFFISFSSQSNTFRFILAVPSNKAPVILQSSSTKCYVTVPNDPITTSIFFFFSVRVYFYGHWQLTGQQGKGGGLSLFHSTTSTRSRTFRHLCAILHVR